jgi:hypothetical protein
MNSYLLLSVLTIISGAFIMAMKICFASKCESISICCGVLKVERNVSIEDTEFHNEEKSSENMITQKQIEISKV